MTRKISLLALPALMALAFVAGCDDSTKKVEHLYAFLQRPRTPVSGVEYRVLPPDVIAITSRHVPEINGFSSQVRPDGKINLPLIGELMISGHTPNEIEEMITKAAKDYYEQVDATVQVASYNSQKFYVYGQVNNPGGYPWTGCDTLLDALMKAHPTFLAWPERITVVRGKQPTKGGYIPAREVCSPAWRDECGEVCTIQSLLNPAGPGIGTTRFSETEPPMVKNKVGSDEMMIDLMAMVKTGDLSRNILLRPDDIIYVRANPLGEIGLAAQLLVYPVSPVLEAARTPANVRGAWNP